LLGFGSAANDALVGKLGKQYITGRYSFWNYYYLYHRLFIAISVVYECSPDVIWQYHGFRRWEKSDQLWGDRSQIDVLGSKVFDRDIISNPTDLRIIPSNSATIVDKIYKPDELVNALAAAPDSALLFFLNFHDNFSFFHDKELRKYIVPICITKTQVKEKVFEIMKDENIYLFCKDPDVRSKVCAFNLKKPLKLTGIEINVAPIDDIEKALAQTHLDYLENINELQQEKIGELIVSNRTHKQETDRLTASDKAQKQKIERLIIANETSKKEIEQLKTEFKLLERCCAAEIKQKEAEISRLHELSSAHEKMAIELKSEFIALSGSLSKRDKAISDFKDIIAKKQENILTLEREILCFQTSVTQFAKAQEDILTAHYDTLESGKFRIGSALVNTLKNPLKLFLWPYWMARFADERISKRRKMSG
jgi:hypothetical protein